MIDTAGVDSEVALVFDDPGQERIPGSESRHGGGRIDQAIDLEWTGATDRVSKIEHHAKDGVDPDGILVFPVGPGTQSFCDSHRRGDGAIAIKRHEVQLETLTRRF